MYSLHLIQFLLCIITITKNNEIWFITMPGFNKSSKSNQSNPKNPYEEINIHTRQENVRKSEVC